ncbi:unnamed protein product [Aphanomyces euteiches]
MYHLPFYRASILPEINGWWGVNPKIKNSGHSEMSVPTYFFLGMVLPVVVGALVFAVVRAKSPLVRTPLTPFLHRKPKFLFRCVMSYGELLFLAVVLGGNALVFGYFWKRQYNPKKHVEAGPILELIALTLGFNGVFNMVFLALPASRHCFWMEWLNIPFAHGVKYHRWLGVATIVAIGGHTLFYIIAYAIENELHELLPIHDGGLHPWQNLYGILSYLCMAIMGITSLPIIRRKFYNVFYYTHFLFIPAALFATLHWGNMIYWLYTSIVLYLVNRMYSSASITAPVCIKRAKALPAQVVQLTLHCATGYTPGDVVWIKVPALSNTQWHPFSVASTPVHTPGLLTVYIKCLGKWSNNLYHYIRQCEKDNVDPIVYMDGGYTPAPAIPAKHSDVVFVGGGIGVTPLMGQLVHILHTHPNQTVWLIWHVRGSDMLLQFRGWLREVEELAASTGGRVNLRLHVTQEHANALNVADDEFTSESAFVQPTTTVSPRPYAHLSTVKRMWMLLLAFGFSAGLHSIVKYGRKIQSSSDGSNMWQLQRVVEFITVVAGAYLTYIVTYIKMTTPAMPTKEDDDLEVNHDKKDMDVAEFISHYKVQFNRAVWADVFREIDASTSQNSTVGVYVSGPKPLVRAVDFEIQGKSKFHVRNEEFEM